MLTEEENEELTRVGAGTPGGELLRRYWHPLAIAAELTEERPKKRVRLLGEDLVLFKDETGYGLIAEHCAHRGCSLYYGFLEDSAIRCPYHGWLYDKQGKILEQPFEPAQSMLKHTIQQPAYPVQKVRGLLFAYLGPLPAPLMPPWDVLVRQDGKHLIKVDPVLTANWVQVTETNVDSTHNHFLHHYMRIYKGLPWHGNIDDDLLIEDVEFELFEWGIMKRRVFGGQNGFKEAGHPVLFPNLLRHSGGKYINLDWHTPVDDTHTQTFTLWFTIAADGRLEEDENDPAVEYDILKDENGEFHMNDNGSQDSMAWETQGPIRDRSVEHLGQSDRGVLVFRGLLKDQIDKVRRGEEPLGILRDPNQYSILAFNTDK